MVDSHFEEVSGLLSDSDDQRSTSLGYQYDGAPSIQVRQPTLRRNSYGSIIPEKFSSGNNQGKGAHRGRFKRNSYLSLRNPNVSEIPEIDNTMHALHVCESKVLYLYQRLLFIVGWLPVFDDVTSIWKKIINITHPLFVILFILVGYVIQYAGCFRRDMASPSRIQWEPLIPANNTSYVTLTPNVIQQPCIRYIISQYIIPDILHSIAYCYSFYTLRIVQSEQLPTLMEKVFVQASHTEMGFRSQGKIIHKLRLLLYLGILWIVLSQSAQIIHIVDQYKALDFGALEPHVTIGRIGLLILMLISFIFLDVVYIAVVIYYCVQALLLIFYIKFLREKLDERKININDTMKEIHEIYNHLNLLNKHPGIAVSIILVNLSTQSLLAFLMIVDPSRNFYDLLTYISTSVAVVLWTSVTLLPIFLACVLTSRCRELRMLGHSVQVRPYGVQGSDLEQLTSFTLFCSNTNMTAKLFLIPFHVSYVIAISVSVAITFLLLFQLGILHVWLK